jgi:hypothetical protein
MADRKVTDYELDDHGVENSQYFQGAGVAYTDFEDIATGAGNNAEEAFNDALEQLASNGWDVSEIESKELAELQKAEAGRQIVSSVSLNSSWDTENKEDVDSSVDYDTEYIKPPETPESEFQKEVSEGEAVLTYFGDISGGAQEILDFCDEEGIPISNKAREELDDLRQGAGMDSDMYYYLSIRVSGEEEPAESKTKARKIANLAEKLIK